MTIYLRSNLESSIGNFFPEKRMGFFIFYSESDMVNGTTSNNTPAFTFSLNQIDDVCSRNIWINISKSIYLIFFQLITK